MSLSLRLRTARSIRMRYKTQGLQHRDSARSYRLGFQSVRGANQHSVRVELTNRYGITSPNTMVPNPYMNQPSPCVFARNLYEDASLAIAYDAAGWTVSMILINK